MTETLSAKALSYMARAKAENTLRAYTADWADFEAYCKEAGLECLPAAPATVANYLADRAETFKTATLTRHLTAIGATRPLLQVAVIPTTLDGLVAWCLGVVGVLVVLGVVLQIGMYAELLVAKNIVAVGYALKHIDGLRAVVPWLFGELYAACRCEGGHLVLHVADAVVH